MFPLSQICCGFVFGCLLSLFEFNTPVFFTILASIFLLSLYFKRFIILSLSILTAAVYLMVYYHIFYSWELPHYKKAKSYQFRAQIVKVYAHSTNKERDSNVPLYFKAKLLNLNSKEIKQTVFVNLAWYKTKNKLLPSDIITGNAKLRPFRTLQNFGNTNGELWAFYNHIKAKGYIDSKFNIQVIKDNPLSKIQKLKYAVSSIFNESNNNWFYQAVLFGNKSLISIKNKEQFKILGISHLFAISGLHIGMMFAIGFYCLKFTFRLLSIQVNQKYNLNILYTCSGLVFSVIYTLLSGCTVSAIRALIMLCVFSLMYLRGYQYVSYKALQLALIISLLINPFQLLNPGIYFSFLAVYILIFSYTNIGLNHDTYFKRFLWLMIIQFNLTIGLLPLVWFLSDGASIAGILVNLIAIPLMAFFILPSIITIIFSSIINCSEKLLLYLDYILSELFLYIASFDLSVLWFQLGELSWQSLILIYLILLMFSYRLTWMLLIPLSTLLANKLSYESPLWQVDILDVGHGLSILISQNNKTYVYDLAAKYSSGMSVAQTQIIPYIEGQKLTVEHTLISHKDNDHSGGLQEWINYGLLGTLLTPLDENQNITACKLGKSEFGMLTINNIGPKTISKLTNNNSCVVRITDGRFSILLPGDIHKNAEIDLIKSLTDIKSTILISPHHGSKTSSSIEFIKQVSPSWVIHSSAFNGRWLMPHYEIVQRYADLNVQQLITGISGHIRIKIFEHEYLIESTRSKQSYWFLVN